MSFAGVGIRCTIPQMMADRMPEEVPETPPMSDRNIPELDLGAQALERMANQANFNRQELGNIQCLGQYTGVLQAGQATFGGLLGQPLDLHSLESIAKARILLVSAIGEDSVKNLEAGHAYIVPSKRYPGTDYLVPKSGKIRVVRNGVHQQEICWVPTEALPWPDVVLARIKMLQADELNMHECGVVDRTQGPYIDYLGTIVQEEDYPLTPTMPPATPTMSPARTPTGPIERAFDRIHELFQEGPIMRWARERGYV